MNTSIPAATTFLTLTQLYTNLDSVKLCDDLGILNGYLHDVRDEECGNVTLLQLLMISVQLDLGFVSGDFITDGLPKLCSIIQILIDDNPDTKTISYKLDSTRLPCGRLLSGKWKPKY